MTRDWREDGFTPVREYGAAAKEIEVGDFIEVPAWRVIGCVMSVRESDFRNGAMDVELQERPEAHGPFRTYRLADGEFSFV